MTDGAILETPWGGYVAPECVGDIAYQVGAAACSRSWSFGGRRRSVKVKGGLYKADFAFPSSRVGHFLDELRGAGFEDPRPSSYAWPWHQRVITPKAVASTLAVIDERFKGAQFPGQWQEPYPAKSLRERRELRNKLIPGPWSLYDLRSAYGWAATLPLPDTRYEIHVRRPSWAAGAPRRGFYLVNEPRCSVSNPPPRFRSGSARQWLTGEELDRLDVQAPEFLYGLEYPRSIDLRPSVDWMLEKLPSFGKMVLRAFWGGWRGSEGPKEHIRKGAEEKVRTLPAFRYNPVLAAFIEARVALRIVPWAGSAAHVAVDSILVPHGVPTGGGLGEWVEKERFAAVWVDATGRWGDQLGKLVRHAGTAQGPNQ